MLCTRITDENSSKNHGMKITHGTFCVFAFAIDTVFTSTTLSPVNVEVPENSSQDFVCSYTGTAILQTYRWKLNNVSVGSIVPKGCGEIIYQVDRSLYNYSCQGDRVTWTILSVTRHNQNDVWKCESVLQGGFDVSNTVSIDVTVPITGVTLIQPSEDITVRENTSTNFQCETSVGLPGASVKWFKYYSSLTITTNDIEITNSSTSSSRFENKMIITTSTLTYNPTRTDNNMRVYCTANNGGQTFVSLRKPLLVVQYPPDSGPTILGGNLFTVIENKTFQLSCSVVGGNPFPLLTWSCYNGQVTNSSSANAVIKNVKFSVTRYLDGTCTCQSSHYSGNKTVIANISVLYSPTEPTITIGNKSVSEMVSVIQGNSLLATCNSSGNPGPRFAWVYNNGTTIGSSQLSISNIQKSNNGRFLCQAENTMRPSSGETVISQQNASITVDVLFPPVIQTLTSQDIVEGHPLLVTCPVTDGNPSGYTFEWTRQRDHKRWQNQTLFIPHILRTEATNYTCTVTNTMRPTVGKEEVGFDSKSFYLNVWYNSSVVNFTLNGTTERLEVKENDTNLQIKCLVESNPKSNITLQNKTQTLKTVVNENILDFSLGKVMCTDAGQYTCFGYNKYNTQNDSQDVSIFVKCSPRPSPYVPLEYNISSALNRPATLKFTALAYPVPSAEEYSWFKKDDPIKNSSETIISVSGLETNLTIVNITQSSFGIYRLIVKNDVNSFQQLFFLQAADIPMAPTKLFNIEEKSTDTSIYLEWNPGFNGGTQQTFVIEYRKTGSQHWKNVTKIHDGETVMNYTIQPLVSDTQYDVILFATNKIGRSKDSLSLTVFTKESKKDGGTSGTLIGVAVGVGLGGGGGVTVVVVLFVYIRRKRIGKGQETSLMATNKKNDENKNTDDEEYGMQDNPMYDSSGPQAEISVAINAAATYSEVKKKPLPENGSGNIYAQVDKSKKTGKPDTKRDLPEKNKKKPTGKKNTKNVNEGDVYENAQGTVVGKSVPKDANKDTIYENPEVLPKRNTNKDGLIYADLEFSEQQKGQKKLVIHGLDDMTEYVQVDFNKKATPLPDSDDENQKSK